jgi:hypothetical protein
MVNAGDSRVSLVLALKAAPSVKRGFFPLDEELLTVTEPTVRRTTEGAGAAYVAVQTAEVEQLERTLPPAPAGPAVQRLSVDGA